MTLKCIRDFVAILLVLILSFWMTACGSSTLIRNLELVSSTAAVVVPLIFATGTVPIDPATRALIIAYLNAVNTATIQAGTELQSNDTKQLKATKIVGYFATAIAPNLPTGIPQTVAAAINAVAKAVADVLAQLQPGGAVARSGTGKALVSSGAVPSSLSAADKEALARTIARAQDSLLALHGK